MSLGEGVSDAVGLEPSDRSLGWFLSELPGCAGSVGCLPSARMPSPALAASLASRERSYLGGGAGLPCSREGEQIW
jgi:hypothetical protein